MARDTSIDILINAKDRASGVLGRFGSTLKRITTLATAFGAVFATLKVARKVKEITTSVFKLGAEYERLSAVSRRTAQNLGMEEEFDSLIKSLEDTNTFGSNAVKVVDTFLRSGLLPMIESLKRVDEQTGKTVTGLDAFVLTAKDLAASAGKSSSEGIELLTQAIKSGRTEYLDQLRITGSVTEAYNKLADSLGVTVADLTDAQRQQAVLNLIMDEGKKVVGNYDVAYQKASKNMLSLKDAVKSIKEVLGGALESILQSITARLLKLTKGFRNFIIQNEGRITAFADNVSAKLEKLFDAIGLFVKGDDLNITKGLGIAEDDQTVQKALKLRNVMIGLKDAIMGILTVFKTDDMALLQEGLLKMGIPEDKADKIARFIGKIAGFLRDKLIPAVKDFVSGVGPGFMELWDDISAAFKEDLLPALKEVIGAVKSFFSNLSSGSEEGGVDFKKLGSIVGNFIGFFVLGFIKIASVIAKVVTGIIRFGEDVFKVTADVIQFVQRMINMFKRLGNAIRDAFNFGVAVIKGSINGIINTLNRAIDNVNNTIDNLRSKPVIGKLIPDVNVPHITPLAEGGIVTKPTLALVGEAGPEAVVPLDRSNKTGSIEINIHGDVFGVEDLTDKVIQSMREKAGARAMPTSNFLDMNI